MPNEIVNAVRENNERYEANAFGEYAFYSKNATRQSHTVEVNDDYEYFRNPFAHDVDRIIHSHSYARYMDKTQVFFMIKNDHITRRSLHVQMVSRIARTIGRCLKLNEDLIEAIAIGHDIGHTPFGHAGEKEIADILEEKNCGTFTHNAQSVRILQKLEKHGQGLNLTLPVLDGILGHNGELESSEYTYDPKNLEWGKLEENLQLCMTVKDSDKNVFPSTLEGCVVRVSDIISYVGKDFEDAVSLGLITPEDMPYEVSRILGTTNRDIIRSLCNDIIQHSYDKGRICFSNRIFDAYRRLKEFNYKRIYGCELIKQQRDKFSKMVRALFETYLEDIHLSRTDNDIFKHFIAHHRGAYFQNELPERIVADFLAGMTDQYFLRQYELRFVPQLIDYNEIENLRKYRLYSGIVL